MAKFSKARGLARRRRKFTPASIGRGTTSRSSAMDTRRCRLCLRWSIARWSPCAITAIVSSARRFIRTRPISAPQGDAVARTLGKCSCCLLRGHGSVVAANSVAEVFLDSLEMEENARSTVYAASLGTIKPITPQEAELLKASFAKNDFRAGKVWDHYKEKAKIAGLL